MTMTHAPAASPATESRPPADGFVHDIFISYSRRNGDVARAIERALENYRPPKGLAAPQRRLNVFLDEHDFRGVEHFEAVDRALNASRKLLVVCSPDARSSRYVNDEVRRFASARDAAHIVAILVAGVPNNEATPDNTAEMAFPEALCEVLQMPLAADYRGFDARKNKVDKGVYYGSWYTMLANLLDLDRDEIEQRDKKRRMRARAIGGAAVVAIVTALSIALLVTLRARNGERQQREVAVRSEALAVQRRDEAV